MIPLPPLSFGLSSSASLKNDMYGNTWDFGGGDWNVNLAGSGTALQTGSLSPWLIAAALGAAWLILRK